MKRNVRAVRVGEKLEKGPRGSVDPEVALEPPERVVVGDILIVIMVVAGSGVH